MHDKLYDNIDILTKFFLTILISVIFNITSSKLLIVAASLLTVYLLLLNIDNFSKYFRILKNYIFLILIISIVYFIIIGFTPFLLFKCVVTILFINVFISNLTFERMHSILYKLIYIIPESEYVSYKLVLQLYYFHTIFMSKDDIAYFKVMRGANRYGFRYGLLPRIEFAKNKRNELDNNLKLNFYKPKYERTNLLSVILLLLVIYTLIIVIIRK